MGWTYTALTEKSEAKLIEITTDDGSLVFVNGTSSSSKTLSVVAEGFTPVSYKWEKKNGDNWTTISGATNSSYTITGVENVGTYRATAYEDANTGYYDIITIASVSDGQGGSSPYLFSLSNENFTINTTNDLKPTTSLNYEVKVTGYHGSSVMTSIASGTPTAEQFKIIIPRGSIFSLKTGTTDTLVYTANTSAALSSENLAETITITYDTNKSETKTITVSCAKNGISPTVTQGTGSVTITDASGNTGTINDGANGVSVSSVTEYYQRTNSATAPTKPTSSSSLGSWKTTVDNPISSAQYLYNCEIIKFSNNTETVTNPVQIAKYVTNGANGKGIASIQNVYKLTTNTTAPSAPSATDAVWTGSATGSTSAWGTVCPTTTTTNKYLWNVERVTYDSNPVTYSVSSVKLISTHGDTGAKGADASQIKDNLLLNSNFGKGNLTSWDTWGLSTNSYSADSTYKHCAKLELGTTTWKGIQQTIVSAKANCTYTVSAMFFTYTANKNAIIGVHCRNSSNQFITQASESKVIQTNNWYQLTLTFTTPANTTNLLLMFGNDQASQTNFTIFVTNCKLEENSVATTWVPNTSEYKGDKGDPGTSITGPRGAYYRGTATSAPSSPVNGDYYFNTSTGYLQTYNGSSWANDTMAVTNFHVLDAINDIISWCASNTSHSRYNTNKGLADSYVDKLLVGTALINKLFAKTITIQHDSSNTGVIQSSNYVADTSGFKMTGEGVAEFNGNTVKINKVKFFTERSNLSIGVGNLETFPSYDYNSILIGSYIMSNATKGGTNVFIGYNIASENSSPTDAMGNNVCIGSGFGSIRGGHENVGIGLGVLKANQDGKENIAIGYRAMCNADSPSNSVGNIGIGKAALYNCKGYGNIQLGTNNIAGSNEPAVLTGSYNILFGYNTGYKITSGSSNTIINNTTVPITTGSGNVIIGVGNGGESSNQSGLTLINGAIKHKGGTLYSVNSSNSFKKVITEEDILTSKTAINTNNLKSLLNVSEIYLRAMAVDSASGTTSQAYSKACSSYITFSNGLKIQWGVIKAGATRQDMYFPISFSGNNTYTLFLTNREPNNSGTDTEGWDYATTINSKTSSSANISIPSSGANFEWIAIGY